MQLVQLPHIAKYRYSSHECLLNQIASILLLFSPLRNFRLPPSHLVQYPGTPEISSLLKLFLYDLCDLISIIFKVQELNWMFSSFLFFIMIFGIRHWYCFFEFLWHFTYTYTYTTMYADWPCSWCSVFILMWIYWVQMLKIIQMLFSICITCTIMAFKYIERYYPCFLGSVFVFDSWMMVGIQIEVLDFTVI